MNMSSQFLGQFSSDKTVSLMSGTYCAGRSPEIYGLNQPPRVTTYKLQEPTERQTVGNAQNMM